MTSNEIPNKMYQKAQQLARYEVGWWKGHHRKDRQMVIENMSKLYELLFGLSPTDAVVCVKLRTHAGFLHDLAEGFEDEGLLDKANESWKETEEKLTAHFGLLLEFQTR